ncbi:xylulokinase [Mycolicibacterium obuense]|uniref:xylulokinase n=1 Tax=Mycolicibacterium obuense TaxID=1807 RepID=UPI00103F7C0D|nr:FGGY family carbohydrate kinase [Mycolicibacterium obuense]
MTAPLVIAVDCSTTAAKAIVVDAAGRVVGSGSQALDTRSPVPHWFEQDASQWWTATDAAIRAALQDISDRSTVAAVCVTHQRESFVCLDGDETPIRPAILWLDGRAEAEVRTYGTERVELLSGKPADITPGLYKLLWLRDHEPETMARCQRVADVHTYLVHAMTGRWVSSTASVDPLAVIDQSTGDYSDELLELAGLRRAQLPELVPSGTTIATLRPQVADAWGVSRDVAVIAGTGDGQAGGIGLGVTDPGAAYLVLGTAVVIGSETKSYVPARAYRSMISAMPGQSTVETFSSSGTYLSTWFRREFGDPGLAGAPDPALERAAADLPIGSERLMTLPYWNGAQTPHWDGKASGVTLGWQGCHTRAHFYRSLLEGIALELRLQLDGLEAARGEPVEVMRATGGGARSALWTQILADVFDRPLEVCATAEVSALGAAAIALTAVGAYDTLPAAAAAVSTTDAVVTPRPDAAAAYRRLRALYERVYAQTRDLLHTLHETPLHETPLHETPLSKEISP